MSQVVQEDFKLSGCGRAITPSIDAHAEASNVVVPEFFKKRIIGEEKSRAERIRSCLAADRAANVVGNAMEVVVGHREANEEHVAGDQERLHDAGERSSACRILQVVVSGKHDVFWFLDGPV